MRTIRSMISLCSVVCGLSCARAGDDDAGRIVAMEQRALDRWGRGDPDGYFEIMSPDITYFDPTTAKRIDGVAALETLIGPLRGKIHIERAEILNPVVQRDGGLAVLTFNLVSHGAQMELDRGLSAYRGPVEDRPLTLVVHKTRAEGTTRRVALHHHLETVCERRVHEARRTCRAEPSSTPVVAASMPAAVFALATAALLKRTKSWTSHCT
jgi:hypothetical protein